MSEQRFEDSEAGANQLQDSPEHSETNLSTKLERRRRIEDLFEEKKLRDELGDFDLI